MNKEIQVLRGVAVLLTIMNHFGHLFESTNGESFLVKAYFASFRVFTYWGGVDLFFAISGYIITYSFGKHFLEARKDVTFSTLATSFWLRRVFRIWPIAFFWLFTTLLLSVYYNPYGYFDSIELVIRDTVAAVLQIANFNYLLCFNFDGASCGRVNISYWSLSLEEQFYFIFPFLLFFFGRKSLYVLVPIVLIQIFTPRWPAESLWFIRTDAISLGVIIGLLKITKPQVIDYFEPKFILKVAGVKRWTLILLVLGIIIFPSEYMKTFTYGTGLLALTSAITVYFASFNKGYIYTGNKLTQVLERVGNISFSMYLAHMPIIEVTKNFYTHYAKNSVILGGELDILLIISVFAILTLLISHLTYKYIETPLRIYGKSVANRYVENKSQCNVGSDSKAFNTSS